MILQVRLMAVEYYFGAFFIALIVSWIGNRALIRRQQDAQESQRSRCFHQKHTEEVSRYGGLAIFTGVAVAFFLVGLQAAKTATLDHTSVLILGPAAMFLLGFWDDMHPLGAKTKLAMQVLIAGTVAAHGFEIHHITNPFSGESISIAPWGIIAAAIWLVTLTNLVNLIDGIDGLAGGISLMMMVLLVNVGIFGGGNEGALMAFMIGGAVIGFLCFNFPPAKIYMGDGGAYFLGFSIGLLTIDCSQKGTAAAALLASIIALGLPFTDIGITIMRRAIKGLPVFRADRRHLHHRLIEAGLTRKRSVILLYALSMVFLCMSLGVFWSDGRLITILAGVAMMVVVVLVNAVGLMPLGNGIADFAGQITTIRANTRYLITLGQWLEMEADRCETPEELWENFLFIAGKMGLIAVRIETDHGELEWHNPSKDGITESNRRVNRVEIHSGSVEALETVSERNRDTDAIWALRNELITEAWFKAANRWQKLNKQKIHFATVAETAKNAAKQAAKDQLLQDSTAGNPAA